MRSAKDLAIRNGSQIKVGVASPPAAFQDEGHEVMT
jgi:hypothetical protein